MLAALVAACGGGAAPQTAVRSVLRAYDEERRPRAAAVQSLASEGPVNPSLPDDEYYAKWDLGARWGGPRTRARL